MLKIHKMSLGKSVIYLGRFGTLALGLALAGPVGSYASENMCKTCRDTLFLFKSLYRSVNLAVLDRKMIPKNNGNDPGLEMIPTLDRK